MRLSLLLSISLLLSSLLLLDSSAAAAPLARTKQAVAQHRAARELRVAQRRGRRNRLRKTRARATRQQRLAQLDKARRLRRRSTRRTRSTRPEPKPVKAAEPAPIVTTRRGPARVDFDERLVEGQSNKSGAIYIFERQGAELKTMVRRRTSFREEILRTLD